MDFNNWCSLFETTLAPASVVSISAPDAFQLLKKSVIKNFPPPNVLKRQGTDTIKIFGGNRVISLGVMPHFQNGIPLIDIDFEWAGDIKNVDKSDKEDTSKSYMVGKTIQPGTLSMATGLKSVLSDLINYKIGISFMGLPTANGDVFRRENLYNKVLSSLGYQFDRRTELWYTPAVMQELNKKKLR